MTPLGYHMQLINNNISCIYLTTSNFTQKDGKKKKDNLEICFEE